MFSAINSVLRLRIAAMSNARNRNTCAPCPPSPQQERLACDLSTQNLRIMFLRPTGLHRQATGRRVPTRMVKSDRERLTVTGLCRQTSGRRRLIALRWAFVPSSSSDAAALKLAARVISSTRSRSGSICCSSSLMRLVGLAPNSLHRCDNGELTPPKTASHSHKGRF
jgi:hypothetical protein